MSRESFQERRLVMILVKIGGITGTFEELLKLADTGDQITLYQGPWHTWMPHPRGVVIVIDDTFLLNGESFPEEETSFDSLKTKDITQVGRKLFIEGYEVSYNGEVSGWRSHPHGLVIRDINKFVLIVHKSSTK